MTHPAKSSSRRCSDVRRLSSPTTRLMFAWIGQNDEVLLIRHYAGAHSWEDFAETWAHYLDIVDALGTAYAFGLRVRPRAGRDPALSETVDFDPY